MSPRSYAAIKRERLARERRIARRVMWFYAAIIGSAAGALANLIYHAIIGG